MILANNKIMVKLHFFIPKIWDKFDLVLKVIKFKFDLWICGEVNFSPLGLVWEEKNEWNRKK